MLSYKFTTWTPELPSDYRIELGRIHDSEDLDEIACYDHPVVLDARVLSERSGKVDRYFTKHKVRPAHEYINRV